MYSVHVHTQDSEHGCTCSDALYDLLMKMVVEPVPADNELAAGMFNLQRF